MSDRIEDVAKKYGVSELLIQEAAESEAETFIIEIIDGLCCARPNDALAKKHENARVNMRDLKLSLALPRGTDPLRMALVNYEKFQPFQAEDGEWYVPTDKANAI